MHLLRDRLRKISKAIRTNMDVLAFRDLVTKAESHENVLQTLHPVSVSPIAFQAQQQRPRGPGSFATKGRSQSFSRSSGSQPSPHGSRRLPHCQLCRTDGHYAIKCPKLPSFASVYHSEAHIAQAFQAQCHVTTEDPDWVADSRATTHMSNKTDSLHETTPYTGPENKPISSSRSV
ncbi:putative transcription factor interactor and regulator CCHC(Zn) family [Helianthus debilis subsp. tardiflorus]